MWFPDHKIYFPWLSSPIDTSRAQLGLIELAQSTAVAAYIENYETPGIGIPG